MTITEAAQNKVDQVINGEGYLGIFLEGGGCSGYKINGDNMNIIKTIWKHGGAGMSRHEKNTKSERMER